MCPHLRRRAELLAKSLVAGLGQIATLTTPIHGDFSADQVLLQDERIGIIDFDSAGGGDPAADLGSFAAHLHREAVRKRLSFERAEAISHALLEAYRRQRPLGPAARIELHFAAALLQFAYSPFRYREPDWASRAEVLLERAEEVASRA